MESKSMSEPKSLQEAIVYFSNPDNCLNFLVARRWPKGIVCPTCGSDKVKFNTKRHIWQCSSHHAKRQFSVKVGTIFEDSPIRLDKWLAAMWMVANCKNGVSSWEIHRALGVTQKSAWFMLHRSRLALQTKSTVRIGGNGKEVEVDETFIGGASRNMHADKRARRITAHGPKDKTVVLGILERGKKVRTMVVPDTKQRTLQGLVREHIEPGTDLMSDASPSYVGLRKDYEHQVIDHAVAYVHGNVHTNGLENYWSLLKRGIKGTYISVEPFHLFRYLDEQSFRYDHRATKENPMNDADRFNLAVTQIVGKRLTYAEVTGKVGQTNN
jgi:transposase-like protein